MISKIKYVFLLGIIASCRSEKDMMKWGNHYQKYNDYNSLNKALQLMPTHITTAQVKVILGEPIDNGFDYRYMVDSTGVNHCPVGAVFNIDSAGKITHWWIDEICE